MFWAALLALLGQDSVVSSPDLDLHYPSAQVSPGVAREMRDASDEEYSRIRHELGCVIGSKVTAIVVPIETWQATGHAPWAGPTSTAGSSYHWFMKEAGWVHRCDAYLPTKWCLPALQGTAASRPGYMKVWHSFSAENV